MKRTTFRTWMISGIGISLALVFAVGYSSYKSLQNVINDQYEINNTQDVINKCENILKLLVDAETGQRGFLITRDIQFLNPYNSAIIKIEKDLDELDGLISDNPTQTDNAVKLRVLVHQIIRNISANIEENRVKQIEVDSLNVKLNLAKKQMDEVRLQVKIMVSFENSRLLVRKNKSDKSIDRTVSIIFCGTILIFIIVIILFRSISLSFTKTIIAKEKLAESNKVLEKLLTQNEEKNWILDGKGLVGEKIRGEISINTMSNRIIKTVAEYTNAKIGAIYLTDINDEKVFVLENSFAFNITNDIKKNFNFNESWIGQGAFDKKSKIIKGKLNPDLNISSGLITTEPYESLIFPFYFENKIKGIIELGFSEPVSEKTIRFVEDLAELLGVGINRSQARERLEKLFEQTQIQAEELETQQEELRVTNDELISKSQLLQASEEELRVQQEELREINFELEEKAKLLQDRNHVIEQAKEDLTLKMKQLELSGKYKSEFLANMSHELRTPLNSILILARILKDNKSANLSDEEAKFASVIFKAGNDLLQLINDILDLAKIESGKIDLQYEVVKIAEIADDLNQLFAEVAKNKEVSFEIILNDDIPETLLIDKIRLEQIIKNLLSNAFKFTPKDGEVKLSIGLDEAKENILFEVSDSGIGIPAEKQKLIFEAFQQADGSTSREYGGTGLGLSICKELSQRMKGSITVFSEQAKGSKFTFFAPLNPDVKLKIETTASKQNKQQQLENKPKIVEKPFQIHPERVKPLLLIIEDDHFFNTFLKKYAIEKGFDVVQVYDGESGVEKIKEHLPDAVLLDIMLPGIDGWEVLKKIKSNERTKSIPVHMMSAGDQRSDFAIDAGALSFMKKPVEKEQLEEVFATIGDSNHFNYKNILLVEDQKVQSDALAKIFREKNINVEQAFNGVQTLEFLENTSFDCIILDINLPDISGLDLLEKIRSNPKLKDLPIVINTAMELDQDKLTKMLKYSNATVMKTNKSSDRLIDEVSLFLHKVKQEDISLTPTTPKNEINITGKTILLVDDDMRNIFALSAILDGYGFKVEIANDGFEALEKLKNNKEIALILMDIMMPKMDGFVAMKEIRKNSSWKKLPIIALTAKAMKEDKENCIAAGANDYITKPIDVEKLYALIKIWLA